MTKVKVSLEDGTTIRVSKAYRDQINSFVATREFNNANECIGDMLRVYAEFVRFKDERGQVKA